MKNYTDTYQHKGLRKRLAVQLREKGIKDENVLQAIENIPRHFFLDSAFDKIAYEDWAFPIGEGQTISQPYTVAYQTELLQIKKGMKVLEIGTGSVYQASVLSEMGARVYTIERQKKLFEKNKTFIFKTKYPNIKFFYGDGFEGLPSFAPFDRIIITAAAPLIPPKLLGQLKLGGHMILPLDEGTMQRMLRVTKSSESEYLEEYFDYFSFVPMLSGKK